MPTMLRALAYAQTFPFGHFFYKLCVHVFYVIYGGRGCVVYLERLAGAQTSQCVLA